MCKACSYCLFPINPWEDGGEPSLHSFRCGIYVADPLQFVVKTRILIMKDLTLVMLLNVKGRWLHFLYCWSRTLLGIFVAWFFLGNYQSMVAYLSLHAGMHSFTCWAFVKNCTLLNCQSISTSDDGCKIIGKVVEDGWPKILTWRIPAAKTCGWDY